MTSADDARRVLNATAEALGQALLEDEADVLARGLPASLAIALSSVPHEGKLTLEQLIDRVERAERVKRGFAREHADCTCRAIAEHLPDELLERVTRMLSPDVAPLLARRERSEAPPAPVHVTPGSSLATGKPGSLHPIADARPDTTQRNSVRDENPHGDRKLSSAGGLR